MTNHQTLLELHRFGQWICSTNVEYMRDHRKRYSELSKEGYVFEALPCDGRCGKNHASRVFMRRLVVNPAKYPKLVATGKFSPETAPPTSEELAQNRAIGQSMPLTALKAIFLKERTWK